MSLFNKVLKNNKGLSLLELIVAVCFLAIVITPVMNSFITAGKINAKSRKLMCANDCAQSIMEGIADKTFYEIATACVGEYGSKEVSANFAMSGLNDGAYNKQTCSTNTAGQETVVYSSGFTLTDASLTDIKTYSLKFTPVGGTGVTYTTRDSVSNNKGFVQTIDSVFRSECKTKLGALNTNLDKHLCIWSNATNVSDMRMIMLCYSGIEWDGFYFDAVVTIVPEGRTPVIGADEDKWYSYYVQVDLYELKKTSAGYERTLGYDATNADVIGPVLSLNTGIKNN